MPHGIFEKDVVLTAINTAMASMEPDPRPNGPFVTDLPSDVTSDTAWSADEFATSSFLAIGGADGDGATYIAPASPPYFVNGDFAVIHLHPVPTLGAFAHTFCIWVEDDVTWIFEAFSGSEVTIARAYPSSDFDSYYGAISTNAEGWPEAYESLFAVPPSTQAPVFLMSQDVSF